MFTAASNSLPVLSTDPGLAEDSQEKPLRDVALVRVRDTDRDVTTDEELMPASGKRAFESEP